jgi:glycosyltransferase involved in cell wall biosynthesis
MAISPRIGIDYTPAYEQGGGIGRYVRELVAALALEDSQTAYHLFVAGQGEKPLPAAPGENFTFQATRLSAKWLARLWQRARLPIHIERWTGPLDLFHATDFVLPPTQRRTKTVLTVHDLTFARVPESTNPRLKAYLDQVVPRSVAKANFVLADSEATKNDLIALYGTQPEKIAVLLSGVNPRFRPTHQEAAIRAKYQLGPAPYLFAIGTVHPRKNYSRLIAAMAHVPPPYRLVIAGGRGWQQEEIAQMVSQHSLEGRVQFIGFADDADLPALYTSARVYAYPSLYEGFGLPILEAFACGTPVLTANVSSLLEVAGDAAWLIDPYDVVAIGQGLHRLAEDEALRQTLIARGHQQASAFTWERAARQLRGIYQAVLAH